MEKLSASADRTPLRPQRRGPTEGWSIPATSVVLTVFLVSLYHGLPKSYVTLTDGYKQLSTYGIFPVPGDPFHFLPCTNATVSPSLDDSNPEQSWAHLFDPNPDQWSWGNATKKENATKDPYSGRGIYLCGYLDVPLDYTNKSDSRIVRLAVTKYQVSGLARINVDRGARAAPRQGAKSERTIVIEPGGPGGSGTNYAWRVAQDVSRRFSDGKFDVLGWDPRGVNATRPAIACFPYDADRDRWSLLTGQYREIAGLPEAQLELADAMNEARFRACWERHGDLPRFVSTAFVARDMEEIRKALGEDELTGYLVSYGTGIGQTYANMFPGSMLYELEGGNSTLATEMLEKVEWQYDPTLPSPPSPKPSSDELGHLVVCADSYDAPEPPEGLIWWQDLWANMTSQTWISGNSRFFNVLPCRHFTTYWPKPAEVYRGDLNHTLRNPVLLIAETYDPATPLRNGRRLAAEMGSNARLIVHHGYGHSSNRDLSSCTNAIGKAYILDGKLPDEPETACFADEKPYLYGVKGESDVADDILSHDDYLRMWSDHVQDLAGWNPRLLRN
ncbi:Uu.00g078740.m01.CDS01 [Anthostomella pinea]|uniref:Uu.00g078740.m01.CDS01 n=1 Tax=Anthostomella pinea TaxID=933095 RepID=A0AAI8VKR7_9PEZI|nr:Uu.00g078740.m01.CDS01 [Anthostomella pinea]